MWGRKVGLNWLDPLYSIFINAAALTIDKCGVKCEVRPAVGLRQIWRSQFLSHSLIQIFEINFINTAVLNCMKCDVGPAVKLIQILTILSRQRL
jgi:hypothetical protein